MASGEWGQGAARGQEARASVLEGKVSAVKASEASEATEATELVWEEEEERAKGEEEVQASERGEGEG